MTDSELEKALDNSAIIRNRLKIRATIKNARAFLEMQEKKGLFDSFIWAFTEGKIICGGWKSLSEPPASTPLSDMASKELKKAGFSFVGGMICCAFCRQAALSTITS